MACAVFENAQHIQKLVREAVCKRAGYPVNLPCRLVAVSKTKPVSDIITAYNAGIRHFGENYIQELQEKSLNADILENCPEIKWHFVGHLQSNKIKLVSKVRNIYMLETVDNIKLADKLNSEPVFVDDKLKVLVQVNSSGESQKSGVAPGEVISLVDHIICNCASLDFKGLMTIGSYSHDYSIGENPDFECLLQCRDRVLEHLSWGPEAMEVSFGMSNDFLHAISMGSTNVRVGSSIFGERHYSTN